MTCLVLLVLGCSKLPWNTAAQWDEVPEQPSWEWILDVDALPPSPPAVDHLGLEGLDVPASYVAAALDQGTVPWCYLSIGSGEGWRADYAELEALDAAERAAGRAGILGNPYQGWKGERWLNLDAWQVFMPVMERRLDLCAEKGFALVELDNMEVDEDSGFPNTEDQRRTYVLALVAAIEARGMGAIHKNAVDLIDLEPFFAALLLEDCVLWDFCDAAEPYRLAGKPVWNAEYPESWRSRLRRFDLDAVCAASNPTSTLVKKLELGPETIVCAAVR